MEDQACVFCSYLRDGSNEIIVYGKVAAFEDHYPVTEGHFLIIPFRHVTDLFEITSEEVADLVQALHATREQLMALDPSIVAFNVGANVGEAAGQTVQHAHVHLIPRRCGDTPEPAGGIRAVIPSRKSYES